MDIRQLRYFQSVVNTGSLTAAAQRVGISQPAITYRLKQLEAELGTQLFVRNARGVSVTDAGATLSIHVDRLLDNFETITGAVAPFREPSVRQVVVGIAPTPARALATDLLGSSLRKFAISIREGFSDELARWVELGEIDCALCYDPPLSARNLVAKPLSAENLVAVGGRDLFDNMPGTTIDFGALAKLTVVLDGSQQAARRLIDEVAMEAGVAMKIVTAASVTVKRELISRGACCTIVPYGLYRQELEAGLLQSRRIVSPEIERILWLIMPTASSGRLAPLARRIASLVDAQIVAGVQRWRHA